MAKHRKASRMLKSDEFLRVKRHGVSARSGEILVAALPGSSRRLGIIVTRRIGNAVQRNRLKRIIRERFRRDPGPFPVGDCVVVPGSGASALNNDEVRGMLDRALRLLAPKVEAVIRESR